MAACNRCLTASCFRMVLRGSARFIFWGISARRPQDRRPSLSAEGRSPSRPFLGLLRFTTPGSPCRHGPSREGRLLTPYTAPREDGHNAQAALRRTAIRPLFLHLLPSPRLRRSQHHIRHDGGRHGFANTTSVTTAVAMASRNVGLAVLASVRLCTKSATWWMNVCS